MTENVNKLTERIKMIEQPIKVKCITDMRGDVTLGKEYLAHSNINGCWTVVGDDFCSRNYPKECFIIVEEILVNEVEKKQYLELSTGLVYDLVFEGDTVNVLKAVLDSREISVHIDNLKAPYLFAPYTKQMQKQQKKNDDLYVLANVTDEVRKLLDDNHVICHAKVNRDTKGLVEFNIMLGEIV